MSQVQIQKTNQFIEQGILSLRKVYVAGNRQDDWGVHRDAVLGLMVNLEVYGYTLSRDLAFALSHLDEHELYSFGATLSESLAKGVLGVRLYAPMYPNFPQQVLDANEGELYLNAVMQGFGLAVGLRVLPKYQKLSREQCEIILTLEPKVLDLAVFDDFTAWVSRMAKANVAYSVSQRDTLTLFTGFIRQEVGNVDFLMTVRGWDIPNKENLSFWGHYVLRMGDKETFQLVMSDKFKVTTDVLRLVAALAATDTSLAGKFVVPKLARSNRKVILSLLDKVIAKSADKDQVLENLLTYRSEWLRVAYACHSGEYANSYPDAFAMLQKLRNEEDVTTYAGKIESLLGKKDVAGLALHLSKRPGVFARMLSRLLMTEAGDYIDNYEATYRKNGVAIVEKKRRNAIAYNERQQRKIQRELRRVEAESREEIESISVRFNNNQMAQQLQRLNLGSLKILEEEAKKFSTRKVESAKAEIIKNNPVNLVPVPEVPKLEDIVYKKKVKGSRDFFTAQQREELVNSFAAVANKVSTPVLLQLHSHYKHIGVKMEKDAREIMPKGGVSKMFLQEGKQARFDEVQSARIVEIVASALMERFAKLPALGNVYIAPDLKKQNVPFAQRSASKSLKTVARGSRFPIDKDTAVLRMFLWWKDSKNTGEYSYSYGTDIDLSVVLYDANYKSLGHCSYWNLRDAGMVHSGDIRSAPNGACEFIDVDLAKINPEAAYVVLNIHSYSGENYCDLPECFGGWMARGSVATEGELKQFRSQHDNYDEYEFADKSSDDSSSKAQKGEIFDARTVKDKVDLASKTKNIMPMVFDVKNREVIWVDTSYGNDAICSNSVNQGDAITMLLKAWNEAIKPNLYDLFELHAKARGTLVEKPEDAESIFALHEGVTPYDFDVITAEYMADEVKEKIPEMVVEKISA